MLIRFLAPHRVASELLEHPPHIQQCWELLANDVVAG